MITGTSEHDATLPSFFAVWFEAKSGQSLQVVCFDPGMQILFLRHHKVADIGLLLLGYVFRWLVAGVPVQIPQRLGG